MFNGTNHTNLDIIKSFFHESCVVDLFSNPIQGQVVGPEPGVVGKKSTERVACQHNHCLER